MNNKTVYDDTYNVDTKIISKLKEDIDNCKIPANIYDPIVRVRDVYVYYKNLQEKLNLAENILYDYLYNDDKITKEKYEQFKGLKEGKQ